MDKEQQQAVSTAVCEFIDIKYELSRYVDDDLIELGERFNKAIKNLVKAAGMAELLDGPINYSNKPL